MSEESCIGYGSQEAKRAGEKEEKKEKKYKSLKLCFCLLQTGSTFSHSMFSYELIVNQSIDEDY